MNVYTCTMCRCVCDNYTCMGGCMCGCVCMCMHVCVCMCVTVCERECVGALEEGY